jgi:lycopene beta-cyclase
VLRESGRRLPVNVLSFIMVVMDELSHRSPSVSTLDYLLVGGGLQNGLIALALRARQPAARIAMIERGPAPGGNHTWCFHAGDVPEGAAAWIEPLVVARWPGYDVAFPDLARRVESPYACISSERLAACVRAALEAFGSALHTGATALEVTATSVRFRAADGNVRELTARAVIDARGPDRAVIGATGWQKLVGQELVLARPHGLERPILIDATVPQRDGFRFWYVLPLAADRLLVEDTYFSNTSELDAAALRPGIAEYAAARGWQIAAVAREESGVLPMPWEASAPRPAPPLNAGYAGGWFHPVTGYSFPVAARLAALVASLPPDGLFGPELAALARAHARQLKFALRLSRMMFRWFAPEQRFRVLERFYRLPEPLVRRFYALELTTIDRARIFLGRPPRGLSLRPALTEAS